MSTLFTKPAVDTDPPAPLPLLLGMAQTWIGSALRAHLDQSGFQDVTDAQLAIFANLDCGATSAIDLARRVGLTRQAISRSLRDLATAELVTLEPDPTRRNTNQIVLTNRGNALATQARAALAAIETELTHRIGPDAAQALRAALEVEWGQAPTL